MRRQIVRCDVCGAEVAANEDYFVRFPAIWRAGFAKAEVAKKYDLCETCAERAGKLLDKGWEVTFGEMMRKPEEAGE